MLMLVNLIQNFLRSPLLFNPVLFNEQIYESKRDLELF